ncbi:hypothetical protein [Nocardiopsis sp. NPDC006938]|uniref:hypothetical protein n=1 Tax=Nocardiopsis sp. NPDC006938 TaxID=3364337 RepID=UPI00368ECA9D
MTPHPTPHQTWHQLVSAYTRLREALRGTDPHEEQAAHTAYHHLRSHTLTDLAHAGSQDAARTLAAWTAYIDHLASAQRAAPWLATLDLRPPLPLTVRVEPTQTTPAAQTTPDEELAHTLILHTRQATLTHHITTRQERPYRTPWEVPTYIPSSAWTTLPTEIAWDLPTSTSWDQVADRAQELAQRLLDHLTSVISPDGSEVLDLTPTAAHAGDDLTELLTGERPPYCDWDWEQMVYVDVRDHITPDHLSDHMLTAPTSHLAYDAGQIASHIRGGTHDPAPHQAPGITGYQGQDQHQCTQIRVVGIVGWLHALGHHLAQDPRTTIPAREWFQAHPPTDPTTDAPPQLTADTTDTQLERLATRAETDAARSGLTLVGAHTWLLDRRTQLRTHLRAALRATGAEVAELEPRLTQAKARRASYVRSILGWSEGDSDADLGRAGRMTRQGVKRLRDQITTTDAVEETL